VYDQASAGTHDDETGAGAGDGDDPQLSVGTVPPTPLCVLVTDPEHWLFIELNAKVKSTLLVPVTC
jgi:hypothetical protein